MTNVQVELPPEKQEPFALRLSQIERNCKYDIENQIFRYITNSRETLRMARVIRELAKFLPAFSDIQAPNPAVDLKILFEAWHNLSPDAKEVVNQ